VLAVFIRAVLGFERRRAVEKILRHLGLPVDAPVPAPARQQPEWLPGFEPTADWVPD
jgi:hypothetical protein